MLAHRSLLSFHESRRLVSQRASIEFILVLDKADEKTAEIVARHIEENPRDTLRHCAFGDAAAARNFGISIADGDYVATLDGDDYVSPRYFERHLEAASNVGAGTILHPEMVVSFGSTYTYNWQVDQGAEYYSPESLFIINPWISASFARREVFESVPFVPCYPEATGFGYEDWHWHLEAIAAGYEHRLAWGSAYFYRRKATGSLNERSNAQRVLMQRSRFFELLAGGGLL